MDTWTKLYFENIGSPLPLLVGTWIGAVIMETIQKRLKKLKLELPQDWAIPLLGIYPAKTIAWKDAGAAMFIEALFTVAKVEAIQVSTDG